MPQIGSIYKKIHAILVLTSLMYIKIQITIIKPSIMWGNLPLLSTFRSTICDGRHLYFLFFPETGNEPGNEPEVARN